eukprot:3833052-Pyramimonas_sp.AAC.1
MECSFLLLPLSPPGKFGRLGRGVRAPETARSTPPRGGGAPPRFGTSPPTTHPLLPSRSI